LIIKKTGERERKKQTFLVVNFIFWELHGTFPNLNFKYCFKSVFFPPETCMVFFFFLTNTIIGIFLFFSSRLNSTTFSNFLENFANFSILQNWGKKKPLVVSSFFWEHDDATYPNLTIKKTLLLM
jgi:hypothetical protein